MIESDPLNQGKGLPRTKIDCLTANGYLLADVVSALQKDIRRCNEKAALFWAWEMQESTGEKNACGYARYLWRRLAVIAAEDIGLVNPTATMLIASCAANYERVTEGFKKPPTQACVILTQAVLFLARSVKNREVDDAAMWLINERQKGHMLPIPDYCLDMHTPRGKRRSDRSGHNGLRFFYEEAAKLRHVSGGNHYAPLVGDKVNVDHYADHSCAETASWDPVSVQDKPQP
jgi:replication-associated recombination protein RarA